MAATELRGAWWGEAQAQDCPPRRRLWRLSWHLRAAGDYGGGPPRGPPRTARAGLAAATPAADARPDRSLLRLDRDHHVHLGGAMPRELVRRWAEEGLISEDAEIPDVHSYASFHGEQQLIRVRDALDKYRGGMSLVEAYDAPYRTLEDFLTLYRAYSTHALVRRYAAEIALSIHPRADVRMSVPFPGQGLLAAGSLPPVAAWVAHALAEARHYRAALQPEQELVILFPRSHFTTEKNRPYWIAFFDALSRQNDLPLVFDFAATPIEVERMVGMLAHMRATMADCRIYYHQGEPSLLPLEVDVAGCRLLLPHVDRIGHAMCLGLALQGKGGPRLAAEADSILKEMASMGIGVEVIPHGNASLNVGDVSYYREFLKRGVKLFVGTDDPGFMGTTLEGEAKQLVRACGLA